MKRVYRLGLGALVLAVLSGGGAGTPGAPAGQEERSVSEAETRRFEAMTKGDVAALDGLLAEELTYTHSTGQVETKRQFLDDVRSGRLKYEFIAPEDVLVRVYGTTAVATGRARIQVRTQGQEMGIQIRYTDVYVKRAGRWKLVAWQSTRLPEP